MTKKNIGQEPSEGLDPMPIKGNPEPRRILVAEDEADIRRFYSEILGSEGYHLDTVADGEAGWNALQIKVYDLLITDRNMPHMSGPELFRKIRAKGLTLPVILATGTFPVDDEGLPFDATLLKPFLASELIRTVKMCLT